MSGRRVGAASRSALRFIHTYRATVGPRIGARCPRRPSCSEYGLAMYRRHGFFVATAKTLARVASCNRLNPRLRPAPRRTSRWPRIAAGASLTLIALGFALILAAPAGATITSNCHVTVNGQDASNTYQDRPVVVSQHLTAQLVGTSHSPIDNYSIALQYAGFNFATKNGATSGNTWSGTIDVDRYATYGVGLYLATTSAGEGDTRVCFGYVWVKVKGNPIDTVAGGVALGAELLGVAGLAGVGYAGGKTPPGFEEEPLTPEQQKAMEEESKRQAAEEERQKKERALTDDIHKTILSVCVYLALPAILLTAGAMATGAPATPGGSGFPTRVSWRPRISLFGMGFGLVGALGAIVLLQQYAIAYPTRTYAIVLVVLGLLSGIVIPSLARIRAVRKVNRMLARRSGGFTA